MLNIEVAYANPQQQALISLQIAAGTTVVEVINKSGILKQFPEIDLNTFKVGIFSKRMALATIVQEGDRIEIYHPLLLDPKQMRKQRARQQKK